MRLRDASLNQSSVESMKEFSKWVLDLGDGKLYTFALEDEDEPYWIKIPNDLILPTTVDSLDAIISSTYPNLLNRYGDHKYLRQRAILAPTNDIVDKVNHHILSSLPGETRRYLSSDQIPPSSNNVDDLSVMYPTEFLNTLNFHGISSHEIELKEGFRLFFCEILTVPRDFAMVRD
ncbi:hypothetical protein RJ639_031158 [Escallonia herrerae]|uniref:ATP-dependent DNA helicase n=1 Tax=Escallonia herrerae TaxID=1293975 RepID=A0AA89BBP7_9ASTE|nr:hypothetical protein RJ639_031158 [Escallonia herrerae]